MKYKTQKNYGQLSNEASTLVLTPRSMNAKISRTTKASCIDKTLWNFVVIIFIGFYLEICIYSFIISVGTLILGSGFAIFNLVKGAVQRGSVTITINIVVSKGLPASARLHRQASRPVVPVRSSSKLPWLLLAFFISINILGSKCKIPFKNSCLDFYSTSLNL